MDENELRSKLRDQCEPALQVAQSSDKIRMKYRKTLSRILDQLTAGALRRVSNNLRDFAFYETHQDLTAALRLKFPGLRAKGILKGCFDRDGVLHLNGGGFLYGRRAKLLEFYAHEIVHAVDGNLHEISRSENWVEAWQSEIDFFSDNGKTKPSEGLAEFGELLLGLGLTRKQMADAMPKCLKAWEEYGL